MDVRRLVLVAASLVVLGPLGGAGAHAGSGQDGLVQAGGAGGAGTVAVQTSVTQASGTQTSGTQTAGQEEPGAEYGRTLLVLDSSGSMAEPSGGGGTKIAAAKQALRTVVGELPEEARVGLRVFGAEVFSRTDAGSCEDSQLVVEPAADNRDDLLAAIEDYAPYGETPIPYALRQAAQDLGGEGARSIVLVSDGESTCPPDVCEVAAELVEDGIDLRIDVVGLSVSGEARRQLECIAEAGGGTFYDANSAEDIVADLTRVTERAVRPFTLTGQRINGGTPDDPAPIGVGDWIDVLGESDTADGSRTYTFDRTQAGSTLRASAVTQGGRGDEGLRIEIVGPDGTRCDLGSTLRQIDARDVVAVQATAAEETDCAEAGRYLVTVERRLGDAGDVRVGLRISDEPPFSDVGFRGSSEIEVSRLRVRGAATEVVGGTSFANATALEPGSYSSTVVPGEALLYKVALQHGQSARVQVRFPAASPALRDVVGLFPPLANVTTYNPMQGLLDNPPGATFSEAVGDDESHDFLTATAAVSRTLVDSGGVNGVADYSTAGDYYVGVSLMRKDYTTEFPFTIDVEVVGEPQPGPTYDGGVNWSVAGGVVGDEAPVEGASGGAEPVQEQEDGATRASEEDAGLRTVGGVAAGVLGAVLLGAAFLLWRRRARPTV